jgi:hypothetical protein
MVSRPIGAQAATSLLVAALAFAFMVGCGGAAPAPGTVQVSGQITLEGRPIAKAAVGFIGDDGARLSTSSTDNDGKFSIRAALGKNVVTVAKVTPGAAPPPSSDEPQLMPTTGEYQKMVIAVKSEVPAKYGDPKTSGLSVDVAESGMKPSVIDLSSK